MSNNMNVKLLLVGSGLMAIEYAKVLDELNCEYVVVGRGEESSSEFEKKTGHHVIRGGIEKYIENSDFNSGQLNYAINAVRADHLYEVSLRLIDGGVKNILSEKPGGMRKIELQELKRKADKKNVKVYIAYNRRQYASVNKAKKMIEEDGGVSSFSFEFTEWRHIFDEGNKYSREELAHLATGNSSHVIDLAFYLGGKPKEWSTYKNGEGVLPWHPNASVFSGAGICENGALFSYQANWDAPGRWGVEVMTKKRRYILRPLERLQVQKLKSVVIDQMEIDDRLDKAFKPGVFLETKKFIEKEDSGLCSLEDQINSFDIYRTISGEEI